MRDNAQLHARFQMGVVNPIQMQPSTAFAQFEVLEQQTMQVELFCERMKSAHWGIPFAELTR